ncbi:hypothetical protein CHELA1G2_21209 [Hyphomicrobiales bacterium]|nr:hypothetical protein CHELA1G2_21209 [Hyphomicrobiales bacterium]
MSMELALARNPFEVISSLMKPERRSAILRVSSRIEVTATPVIPSAITAQKITVAALGAAESDGAIVHLHALIPRMAGDYQTVVAYAPFLKSIRQRSDIVVNTTTGGWPRCRSRSGSVRPRTTSPKSPRSIRAR